MDNFGGNQFGQQYNQQYSQQPNLNSGMNAPDYMLWLILGIIQIITLCCCNCVAPIFGIITVVTVIGANNKYKAGDIVGYQSSIKTAKIVNIVGWVIMFAGSIIGVASGMLSSILEAVTNTL